MGDSLTRELLASALEEVLDADALLLGDAGGQAESLDAAAHTDAENHFGCERWLVLNVMFHHERNRFIEPHLLSVTA